MGRCSSGGAPPGVSQTPNKEIPLSPAKLRPVHRIWPVAAARAPETGGARAFRPKIGYAAIRPTLESWLLEAGVHNACEFGLHAIRRGAAQEMMRAARPTELALASGRWKQRSAASCLDKGRLGELAMQELTEYVAGEESGPPSSRPSGRASELSETSAGPSSKESGGFE